MNQNLPTVNFAGNIPSFFQGGKFFLKKSMSISQPKTKKRKNVLPLQKCVEKTLLQGLLYIASLAGGHPSWIHPKYFFRQ